MAKIVVCNTDFVIDNQSRITCPSGSLINVEYDGSAFQPIIYDELFWSEMSLAFTMGFFFYIFGWLVSKPIEIVINYLRSR